MTRAEVLVVGEALVDVVHRADGQVDETPGGSPANVALALGRLGIEPRLLTQLGDDARGDRIRHWLEESGVEVMAAPAVRTATATAHLDANGSARYAFDIGWDLDAVAVGDRYAPPALAHAGSIATFLEPGAAKVRQLLTDLRETSLITYDPNIRPSLLGARSGARRQAETFIALSDLVKASDEDLAWLYPGLGPLDAARSWVAAGAAVVVVTLGQHGAVTVTSDRETRIAGHPAEVVDTVGAGDTFMAALIAGLVDLGYRGSEARERLRRIDADTLRSLLTLSAHAAAITVSRPGADPPRRDELPGPPSSSVSGADTPDVGPNPPKRPTGGVSAPVQAAAGEAQADAESRSLTSSRSVTASAS
ncbi:fructokinase [Microbacterium sp. ZKA21]|uniref:carbohydrate kinase family protein n=1 Tax=Microbacterium sp. ZKA21 TaxID=3381694 RepID=UPI003D1A36F8